MLGKEVGCTDSEFLNFCCIRFISFPVQRKQQAKMFERLTSLLWLKISNKSSIEEVLPVVFGKREFEI